MNAACRGEVFSAFKKNLRNYMLLIKSLGYFTVLGLIMVKNIPEVAGLSPSGRLKEKVSKRPSQRFGIRPFSAKAVASSASQKEKFVGKIAAFGNFDYSNPGKGYLLATRKWNILWHGKTLVRSTREKEKWSRRWHQRVQQVRGAPLEHIHEVLCLAQR